MNKEVQLIITLKAGSDFQYEHGRSLLDSFAKATANHYRSTHKANEVQYSLAIDEFVQPITESGDEEINSTDDIKVVAIKEVGDSPALWVKVTDLEKFTSSQTVKEILDLLENNYNAK